MSVLINLSSQAIAQKLLLPQTKDFLRKYHVKHVWLFGSQARGDDNISSDIDILYEYDHSKGELGLTFMNTQIYLEKLLGREVDFVDKDSMRSGMSDFIASDMQVIW